MVSCRSRQKLLTALANVCSKRRKTNRAFDFHQCTLYQFRMGVEQKNNLNKFAMAARGDPSVLVESTGLFGLS